MDNISPILLRDTLNLIQLARETARTHGIQSQAEKLEPVVDELQALVKTQVISEPVNTTPTGILAQPDFEFLLNTTREEKLDSTGEILQRNRMVMAMSEGGMNDVDIARQFGMSRDEVRTIVSLNQQGNSIWR